MHPIRSFLQGILVVTVLTGSGAKAGDRPLTYPDLMQFRQIRDAAISRDGGWVACTVQPDRGDGEVQIISIDGSKRYAIPRGEKPVLSPDGRYVVAVVMPPLEETEKAAKSEDEDDLPKSGMAILDTADGAIRSFERVELFALSDDGRFLAWRHFKENEKEQEAEEKKEENQEPDGPEPPEAGADLVVLDLVRRSERRFTDVTGFIIDDLSRYLVFTSATVTGAGNGAFLLELDSENTAPRNLATEDRGYFANLARAEDRSLLAFTSARQTDQGDPGDAVVHVWDGTTRPVASSADAPEGWALPGANKLEFSRDGRQLFFGFKPVNRVAAPGDDAEDREFDPYDIQALVSDRTLDVWHWNDPRIIPNQKTRWEKIEKDRTYKAVVHLKSGKVVPLGDATVRRILPSPSGGRYALGLADRPYLKERTWYGPVHDLYHVDLSDGSWKPVHKRFQGGGEDADGGFGISPGGRYVVYYDDGDWHLFDGRDGTTRNLTAGLDVPFANEDHDYPSPAPGYGLGGWIGENGAVLLYDKFDVWRFPLGGGRPLNLTAGSGRKERLQYRVIVTDPEQDYLADNEPLLLSAYHDLQKYKGLYAGRADGGRLQPLAADPARYTFLAKAEQADTILFTRQTYRDFPDLQAAGPALDNRRQLTNVNPQIDEFAWGGAELVEWTSADGHPLQGVLIRPGNYEPGKRYPVLVYYYRFFSPRLHLFNEPVVNHRPSFPMYASNGYAVFLPDIHFQVGQPGFSATKSLVPGVQKLVDMGIADPNGIGLHGHSWSGYQTAFVITQTDIFAAAVAGAPVANMTSAYSGIRLETGLARQFQYEQSQSRIGGSLWEFPERYIENSPVFFADRINTPLLIQTGDVDEAVPWHQSVEMYLAMRRLGKDCVFLQYRDEPHHLKKYPNKLDYSIKMMEFFDHHLKGKPAPSWMTLGVPYTGK